MTVMCLRRVAVFLLVVFWGTATARAESVTLHIVMGRGAESIENWDGSVQVRGGEVTAVEEWHFAATDAIVGSNAWRANVRRDDVPQFARVNYTEMSPAHRPPLLYFPIGVYVTVEAAGDARVAVSTTQGDFEFDLSAIGDEVSEFADGRVTVARTSTVGKVTSPQDEDDDPALIPLGGGEFGLAWIAYVDGGDNVLFAAGAPGAWRQTIRLTDRPADRFRVSLAKDADGGLWVFWSERDGASWTLWGRRSLNGSLADPVRISKSGSATFHRAASSADGRVYVVWQQLREIDGRARSDIFARSYAGGEWGEVVAVSQSAANDWEPAIAGGPGGKAYVAWDSYEKGNYDVVFAALDGGRLGDVDAITTSERFQAHASVAVDATGRPWVAWDESGAQWAKDQGYMLMSPLAVPIHQERTVRVARRDGDGWVEPKAAIEPWYVYRLFPNMERPQIAFDGGGSLHMILRHWDRQRSRSIGSHIGWENYHTRLTADGWTQPVPVPHSRGSIEKPMALAPAEDGSLAGAWMTDGRVFANAKPVNAEIYAGTIAAPRPVEYTDAHLKPFVEAHVESIPSHPNEAADIERIREYTIDVAGKEYKIYRGDMHRHTDVSQDFKYDGSVIEVFRYGMDAAGFDYIVPTDHQIGYDQEYTWWLDEKLKDLFHVPGAFTPLFGYERSLTYPNGHRNIIFPERGTRTLPIPDAEKRGEIRAGPLYEYLRENNGISMPHSSGTDQGTDWADNDPELEPVFELFQGYRASYEYQDAPWAASDTDLRSQRSGYNPLGYWWNALEKGYKIGVQASSDHWSTHISYACIVTDDFTREGMFDALKKRHTYAATDNIILDFQAEVDGKRYLMGDVAEGQSAPRLIIKAIGTQRIKQITVVKNSGFLYERSPNVQQVHVEFTDRDYEPGGSWYYVRVLQTDGMLAWSSPIWIE